MRKKYFYRVLFTGFIAFSLFSKVNSQAIEWQQVLGGAHSEYMYDVKATPDYGFLIVGSSFSEKSGNKSEKGQGDLDYFLWKMDESGKLEWQKSFGGSGSDYLYSAALTQEGGYILGGSSDSPKSGDKKEEGFGNMDFWIIKLDPEGNEEWQITLGGIGNDQLQSIQQTKDGGFILGGSSDSSPLRNEKNEIIGNKSEVGRGSHDYWIVKLSATGQVEWEKTYGGNFSDQLKSILLLDDGYLIGGTSNSTLSYDRQTENFGLGDFWILKLDEKGKEVWQKSYGGEGDESLAGMIKSKNGFLIAGSSSSETGHTEGGKTTSNGNGTDFWILEIDKIGNPLWDATYDIGKWDILVSLNRTENDEYLLGGYASSETLGRKTDAKGINDFVAIKINARGELLWQKTVGGTGSDQLKGLVQMRDGGYLLAGNSDSKKSDDKDTASIGGNDYWVVKLGNEDKKPEERKTIEVYPNPTYQFTNIIVGIDFKEAKVEVFDMVGRKLQSKAIKHKSTAVDLQGYAPGVYVFKIILDGQVEDVKVIKKGN